MENNIFFGIMKDISESLRLVYGDKLKEIILYGSYARGTADESSDVDLLILVDANQSELNLYEEKLSDVSTSFALQYLKVFSLIDISYKEYNFWKKDLPFYKNVEKEGIKLYAA
jgi:predicted nucleotidyltransferase